MDPALQGGGAGRLDANAVTRGRRRSSILAATVWIGSAWLWALAQARPSLAAAGSSDCVPTLDQLAEPLRLPLGQVVTVTLRLSLECRAARTPLSMALVIDRSSSMLRSDAIGKAREGALRLVDRLRAGEDWGTLVTFNEAARVDQTLTDVPALLRQAVLALRAGGDTNISAGLAEGHRQLRRLADRPYLRALVLLTDGKNESGAQAVIREAEALRRAGVYVAVVGLGRDPERDLLEAVATSPADAWFPQDPAELPAIFERIGERWTSVQVREAKVRDLLPPDLRMAGPALPAGREAPTATWNWDLPAAGRAPIDIRLRLRPSRVGRQPVSSGARLTWRDQTGQSGDAPFPVPEIDVYDGGEEPGGGATATGAPAATATPRATATAGSGATATGTVTRAVPVTPTTTATATPRGVAMPTATRPSGWDSRIHLPALVLRLGAPTWLARRGAGGGAWDGSASEVDPEPRNRRE